MHLGDDLEQAAVGVIIYSRKPCSATITSRRSRHPEFDRWSVLTNDDFLSERDEGVGEAGELRLHTRLVPASLPSKFDEWLFLLASEHGL